MNQGGPFLGTGMNRARWTSQIPLFPMIHLLQQIESQASNVPGICLLSQIVRLGKQMH